MSENVYCGQAKWMWDEMKSLFDSVWKKFFFFLQDVKQCHGSFSPEDICVPCG